VRRKSSKLFFIFGMASLGLFFIGRGAFVSSVHAGSEICAVRYQELDKTPSLQGLRAFFPENTISGFVNETAGSYFELSTLRSEFELTFFTTGFLSMYLIRRGGAVQFCDVNGVVEVRGLDRGETLVPSGERLIMGGGGPRKTFSPGAMPLALREAAGRSAPGPKSGREHPLNSHQYHEESY
jgi:hypothetical protein